jgi:hypothetical protein
MSDEVSVGMKIGITVMLIAALLSSVVLVFYNTNALLSTSQNASIEAVKMVSTQNIMRLRNDYRRYIDLYKTYEYYEESINSIYGVELDGTQHIHYLRNADWVNTQSPLSAVCSTNGLTGIQNIDNMYNNFMNEFCDEEHSSVWISISVYPDKNRLGYDIYYEVIDRQGG